MEGFAEVGAGRGDGLRWTIWTGRYPGDPDLFTLVERAWVDRGASHTSGFAGPLPTPDEPVQWWQGSADDLPIFLLARSRHSVIALRVELSDSSQLVLPIPALVDSRGLRYVAAPMPSWVNAVQGTDDQPHLRAPAGQPGT
jgi:hypothetical protein